MPIDQTQKRRKVARDLTTQAAAFTTAVSRLSELQTEITEAELTFEGADFEGQDGLMHISPAELTAMLTTFGQALTWLNTSGRLGKFLKVKQ